MGNRFYFAHLVKLDGAATGKLLNRGREPVSMLLNYGMLVELESSREVSIEIASKIGY